VGQDGVDKRIAAFAMAIQMGATVYDLEESESLMDSKGIRWKILKASIMENACGMAGRTPRRGLTILIPS
jgi:hypothetical protein